MRWHKTIDGLPKKDGKYLVYRKVLNDYKEVDVVSFSSDMTNIDRYGFDVPLSGFYLYDSEWGYYEVPDVLYWTSLPSPPTE